MAAAKSHHNCPKIRYQAGHTIRQLLLTRNARLIPASCCGLYSDKNSLTRCLPWTRPNLNAHSYRLRRIANAAMPAQVERSPPNRCDPDDRPPLGNLSWRKTGSAHTQDISLAIGSQKSIPCWKSRQSHCVLCSGFRQPTACLPCRKRHSLAAQQMWDWLSLSKRRGVSRPVIVFSQLRCPNARENRSQHGCARVPPHLILHSVVAGLSAGRKFATTAKAGGYAQRSRLLCQLG